MATFRFVAVALLWASTAGAIGCGTASNGKAGASAPGSRAAGWEVRPAASEPEEGYSGGVGMSAQEGSGSIDQEDAEEAINRNFARLSRCYAEAGDARDFADGGVTLRFLIGRDGRAKEVHVIESRLGSLEVERCLRNTALSIRFPRPHGQASATFEYSLEFRSTGEVPLVELPPDAAASSLPALLVRVAAGCRELGVDEVKATLYIDRAGKVRSVGFASKKPLPDVSAGCLAETIRASRIPVEIKGPAVGRTLISLRNQDVLHPPALVVNKRPKRRPVQGRRPLPRR
jgi:hypothetical protein